MPSLVVLTVPAGCSVGARATSPVLNGNRLPFCRHEASSPSAEPLEMNSANKRLPQSDIELWLQFLPTIWRLCDRYRAASAASHGGVTGSTSPDTIKTGTSDFTGSE